MSQIDEPLSITKPIDINCQGYEVVEKVAKQCATSARVLVPKHWIGKKVLVIRIES